MTAFGFRPIEPSDRPALEAIARQTWSGSDYLPYVMDDWMRDPRGEFTAVTVDGRFVGCGKLSFTTPTDAWLEGLRKDPASPHKGVASAVTSYFLSRLRTRTDITSIRFATYFDNTASIASAEKLGFRRAAVFSWKCLEGKTDRIPGAVQGRPPIRAASTADGAEVRRLVESSSWREASGGLLVEGWKALPYSWELFRDRYLARGQCRVSAAGGRLTGLSVSVVDLRYPFTYLKCVFLEAEDSQAEAALIDDMVGRVREGTAESFQAEIVLPPGVRAAACLESRGFRSEEQENDFLVFEYPRAPARGQPAPPRQSKSSAPSEEK